MGPHGGGFDVDLAVALLGEIRLPPLPGLRRPRKLRCNRGLGQLAFSPVHFRPWGGPRIAIDTTAVGILGMEKLLRMASVSAERER